MPDAFEHNLNELNWFRLNLKIISPEFYGIDIDFTKLKKNHGIQY